MATTAKIVVQHKRRRWALPVLQLFFWAWLVVAIGVSRTWFGGAFIIEFAALVFGILALIAIMPRVAGIEVEMTAAELRRWLDDGAPPDVSAWRQEVKSDTAVVINPSRRRS